MTLRLYSFFHLNLMFSSVEVEQRPYIIEHCYWPLLRLAKKYDLPIGIEAPACTLEFIQEIDPCWITELRLLVNEGPCEFIGCGYSQIIGPLVPSDVNRANLRLGMQHYQSILGIKPTIALVNEQAYSSGVVPLYVEAGYKALIMEWNNPASSHPEWDPEFRYFPQFARGVNRSNIGLIWNQSIAFQKFQRYAHNEIELDEIVEYIRSHNTSSTRYFPLYGSDAEIFDFRPGRFLTESPVQNGEWDRIEALIKVLKADSSIHLVSPSDVLSYADDPSSGKLLSLESPDQPIPVKKQGKYNVLRWALTGRDDLSINSRCHSLHKTISGNIDVSDADMQELCYLWSSDFRTHITSSRWNEYEQRLSAFETRLLPASSAPENPNAAVTSSVIPPPNWSQEGRWLKVFNNDINICFNCRRGLAIESFSDLRLSNKPLFGTLHHGRFDDIAWGADFYSGHIVYQTPGSHQITDLQSIDPIITTDASRIIISASISTPLGIIHKIWSLDASTNTLNLRVKLDWPDAGLGRFRFVPFTFFPEVFKPSSFYLAVLNGGDEPEMYSLSDSPVDHGKAVSFLVSSQHALGLTDGSAVIGDDTKKIQLKFDPARAALLGQIQHQPVDSTWFTRLSLSARELDDTAKPSALRLDFEIEINSMPH